MYVKNQYETQTTKRAAQLINTVKQQHKNRMKLNTRVIRTPLENCYWQAHIAVDLIFNGVLPEDGPVGPF
jgi:hypothetical protein